MDDETLIAYWTDYISATGSRPQSIRNRVISLRALLRRSGKPFATLTRHDLIRDLAREGLSPASRQNYKSLYHSFFTWMQDEEFRLDNPAARLPKVRVPRQEPNPVTTEDIETLLHSGIYRRTRLWVLLYAYQGFRAVEIASVSGETIDYDRRRILSKDGKGGKEVWRPIHDLVWDELQKWPRQGHLFPSPTKTGQHVTPNNVSRVLSDALKRAGIEHRPHQMRAWYATELIDAGASTMVVAAALRHSSTQTVEKYALVRSEAIEALAATLPRVRVPDRSGRRKAA